MKHQDQRVGVFIDTQNMYYSARYLFKRKVDFKHIVDDATHGRKLIRAMAYVIKTKNNEEQPFFEALEKAGIELRQKDLIEYASGHKKGDWDVGLTIDVVRMLDMLDVIVLISGDGDYIPLVQFAQARGRIVEVMSFGETTSANLYDVVDHHTDLSQNKKRYLIGGTKNDTTYNDDLIAQEEEADKIEESEMIEKEKPTQEQKGFFMKSKKKKDQEEARVRKLEF